MTLRKSTLISFLLMMCLQIWAQNDTIALNEVLVSDTQLRDFSGSQSVLELNDSITGLSGSSLTSLLQYNTVIYFKENGLGMVSSPSFRGTTAQQTAVVWNGININSQLNGQTDFNTLNAGDFNSVTVKAGGGSVAYGSSAIGGSIHLDNNLLFNRKLINSVRSSYGSYNTLGLQYNISGGTEKFSADASFSRNSSDNDYPFPGSDLKNDNGHYYNTSGNVGMAYRITPNDILRFYSYAFDGERHFSRTLAAPSRSKYRDLNTRNLLEWTAYRGSITSRFRAAYLYEKYKYYENFATDIFTFGRVATLTGKYDLAYETGSGIKLNAILEYSQNKGDGSDIVNKKRQIGAASLLMSHKVTDKVAYELGVRKEASDAYSSPFLFSAGANVEVAPFYTVKFNASRNFRIPTFNDLYWQGSGNPDLNPETSLQAEIGNVFRHKDAVLTITGYYIQLRDMLRWIPSDDGIWRPENLDKAKSYGLESILNWEMKIGGGQLQLAATYAYTISQKDGSTTQLIYVPYHKATASAAYAINDFSAFYRHLFTGEVFYTTDNLSSIDPYNVSSVGVEYSFGLWEGLHLGVQANNIWNEEYQTVNVRPMPGRNYNMYLNLKF